MALTELIFGDNKKARVGVIAFDATPNELHSNEAETTDHPVEEGSDISDHVRKRPRKIELNGLVTNTPIVFLASLRAESPKTDDLLPTDDRVETAYAELKRVQDAGETVDVFTTLEEYEGMMIESIPVTRDARRGNMLDCGVVLKELQTAKALSIEVPAPIKAANKAAKNAGKKSKKGATAAKQRKINEITANNEQALGAGLFGGPKAGAVGAGAGL
jgi:hypothetical protein